MYTMAGGWSSRPLSTSMSNAENPTTALRLPIATSSACRTSRDKSVKRVVAGWMTAGRRYLDLLRAGSEPVKVRCGTGRPLARCL